MKKKKNEKLKQALKQNKLSYDRLGRIVGVTGQSIYNAVNGTMPHENTRKAIAKALDCSVEDIFEIN